MQKKSWQSLFWIGCLMLTLVLTGCGGSDSSSSATDTPTDTVTTVSGVAAAGAPLIGWVTLADSEGVMRGPVELERDGSFNFDVKGLLPPFYLLAEGTAGMAKFHLHQVAKTPGISNVNPITDLIAETATEGKFEEILPDGITTDESIVGQSPAAVVDAEAILAALDEAAVAFQVMLQPLLDLFDATIDDYMNKTFVADGTGADQFFDTVEVSINGDLFSTYEVIDKATKAVIATGDLQLDAVKNASPIDETIVAAVKEIKSDMDEIGPFISEWLTGLKNATATWLTAYQAANGNATLEDAADQAFYDAIRQHYVSDATAFGWNDGVDMDTEIWQWLEDWNDILLIEGMSNLAVINKGDDGRYLLTGVFLWNGTKIPLMTPIAVIKEGDAWKATGNGYRVDCDLYGNTERMIWTDGLYDDISGFGLYPTSLDPQVHHVVIFGPGMPMNGLAMDPTQIIGGDMWVNETDRYVYPNGVGAPSTYVPDNVNDVAFGDIYTWEVYDSSNNLLQSVTSRLEGHLIDLSAKTPAEKDALFPSIDNIGTQNLDWLVNNVFGGQFTFEYTPSQTVDSEGDVWLYLGWWDNAISSYEDLEFEGDPATQTATTFVGPAPAGISYVHFAIGIWSPTYGDIETRYNFTTDSQGNEYAIEYQFAQVFLQYRVYEDATAPRYAAWLPLTKNGVAIQETDIVGIELFNSTNTQMIPTNSGFLAPYSFMLLNCMVAPCSESGPSTDSGFYGHIFTEVAADVYSVKVATADGQTLSLDVPYSGQLVLPVVTSATMQSAWVGNDLVLSWTNPSGATNWSEVDQLRIILLDGTGTTNLYVSVSPSAETVTINQSLLTQAAGLGDGTLPQWQVQTRAYDANNMNFARGYSNNVAIAVP